MFFAEREWSDWKWKHVVVCERLWDWDGNQTRSANGNCSNHRLYFNYDWVSKKDNQTVEVSTPRHETLNKVLIIISTLRIRYILLGASLFQAWENWDYLDGSYFCFISLSSIGFGDLVPGATVSYTRIFHYWKLQIPTFTMHFNSLVSTTHFAIIKFSQ